MKQHSNGSNGYLSRRASSYTLRPLHQWPPFYPMSLHTKVICGILKSIFVILRKWSWSQHKESRGRLTGSNKIMLQKLPINEFWKNLIIATRYSTDTDAGKYPRRTPSRNNDNNNNNLFTCYGTFNHKNDQKRFNSSRKHPSPPGKKF